MPANICGVRRPNFQHARRKATTRQRPLCHVTGAVPRNARADSAEAKRCGSRPKQVGCVLTHALRPPTRPAKLVRQAAPYVLGRHAAIELAEELSQPFGGGADVSAAQNSSGRIAQR